MIHCVQYFGDTPKARQAWAVLIAISAAGSLVSKVYTTAKGLLRNLVGFYSQVRLTSEASEASNWEK